MPFEHLCAQLIAAHLDAARASRNLDSAVFAVEAWRKAIEILEHNPHPALMKLGREARATAHCLMAEQGDLIAKDWLYRVFCQLHAKMQGGAHLHCCLEGIPPFLADYYQDKITSYFEARHYQCAPEKNRGRLSISLNDLQPATAAQVRAELVPKIPAEEFRRAFGVAYAHKPPSSDTRRNHADLAHDLIREVCRLTQLSIPSVAYTNPDELPAILDRMQHQIASATVEGSRRKIITQLFDNNPKFTNNTKIARAKQKALKVAFEKYGRRMLIIALVSASVHHLRNCSTNIIPPQSCA